MLGRSQAGHDVVVDVQNGVPYLSTLVTSKPVVNLVHHVHREQWPLVFGPRSARFGWWLESQVAPAAYRRSTYVTVSQSTRRELIDLGVDADRITVIHNGTDATADDSHERSVTPRILVLGRLVPQKRVEIALDAVARLRSRFPTLHLDVVGSGWWDPMLREHAARLGIEDMVTFHAHVSEGEKHRLLAQAWVHAMPSLKEGWGLVVVEAGVGSGALSMSLLRAVGETGRVHSFERREDFAEIAKANAREYFGGDHPAWTVTVGDLVEALPRTVENASVDRVVLDMLAPWECLEVVADALAPGGVLLCYVATATQLSKVAEAMRDADLFTEPQAWETLVRGWHLEGLAVRPQHRMHGHTGFLITTRRLAPGVTPPLRKRRPGKGYVTGEEATEQDWTPEAIGERVPSDKRVRRVVRSVTDTSPLP